MRACIYEEYGSADVVRVGDVAPPRVGASELLVRVRAASVTTADWRFRGSAFPSGFGLAGRLMLGLFRPRNPVLGMDFSGVVERVGARVTRFRPGDAVFGATSPQRRGTHAEYVSVRESDAVIRKPTQLGDEEAAAIPFGGSSALVFMRDVAQVRPGQRVLVVGASGSVGSFAVQLARHFGAEVTGVCSEKNAELVRSLGARHIIDYAKGDPIESQGPYNLIFDTIGVTTFSGCKHALTDDGAYLPINTGVRDIVRALIPRRRGKRFLFAISRTSRGGLELLVKLIQQGVVTPVLDRVYPMTSIVEAHRHVESRHKSGNVVVRIAN